MGDPIRSQAPSEQSAPAMTAYHAAYLAHELTKRGATGSLATMSHEIRTPMNGVIRITELLLLSPLSPEQTECATTVRDSGESLLRGINDILGFSKIEAGSSSSSSKRSNSTCRISSSQPSNRFAPQFRAKNVELSTWLDPGIPNAVSGDPGRLRQILVNLLGNALKFTPAGGCVRVRAAACYEHHRMLRGLFDDLPQALPLDSETALRSLSRLSAILMRHLRLEDDRLYPDLIAEGDVAIQH